jgi:hypothetical protein
MLSNSKINIVINSSQPFSLRTQLEPQYGFPLGTLAALHRARPPLPQEKALIAEGNEHFTDKTAIKWIN